MHFFGIDANVYSLSKYTVDICVKMRYLGYRLAMEVATMIYWAMAGSLIILGLAVFSTYRDYQDGKVARLVFTRLRMILILLGLMFVVMMLARITGVTG